MYETEVNSMIEPVEQLKPEGRQRFAELTGNLTSRTVLPWSEHCTECVWPTCYSTCDLYEPRIDGKCRRFVNGMVRLPFEGSVNSYLLKITFKRWAKLWTPANIHLYSREHAQAMELQDRCVGGLLRSLPLPSAIKKYIIGKRYYCKKKRAAGLPPMETLPDCFLVECFNPYDYPVRLTLALRPAIKPVQPPFEKLIEMKQGFNRIRVLLHEIAAVLDVHGSFTAELTPNEIEDGTTLYFGLIDFVKERAADLPGTPSPGKEKDTSFKCMVWDLDHTLWEGILVEDGPESLHLKPGLRKVIEELDSRGILHSIASKNNTEEALEVLKKFDLQHYFLYPQISWGPKSEGIKAIASQLNIGLDSIAFIDDSEFELAEVQESCPQVHLLKANDYLLLPEMKQCQVPVTEDSRTRRKMYQAEAVRQSAAAEFGGDYLSFLRRAKMKLRIDPLMPANLERVHELTQRTNQMNFSGNRYDRGRLQTVLEMQHLDTYVLSSEDNFGRYGIVGFSIIDNREPRMIDLMFSCRVQSKRVEHAFLTYILKKYRLEGGGSFRVNYRKTQKNSPAGRVFEDMGLMTEGEKDGVTSMVFSKEQDIPDDGIIEVLECEHVG